MLLITDSSMISVDLVGAASDTYTVTVGKEITIPIYVDANSISGIKPYLSNYNGQDITSASLGDVSLSSYNYITISNGDTNGIVTCYLTIYISQYPSSEFSLVIEGYKKGEWQYSKLLTIDFKVE
jgi:hypothetical protein